MLVTKEKSGELEKGNLARHKTRNPETENVSRRTAITMRKGILIKLRLRASVLRLDNGSPSFTLKPVVADYDIRYFVFTSSWSRYAIPFLDLPFLAGISSVSR